VYVLFFNEDRDRSFPTPATLVTVGSTVLTAFGTMMRDFSAAFSETGALFAENPLRSIGCVGLAAAAFIWLNWSFWVAACWSQGIEHEQAASTGNETRVRARNMRRRDRAESMAFTIVTTVGAGGR
jgi:hypothetical protein